MLDIEHLIGLVRTPHDDRYPMKAAGIQRRTLYQNRTRWTLTVIDRHNLKHRVQNETTPYTQEFIIRDEYLIPPAAFEDLQRIFIERANDQDYADLKVFQEAFYKQYELHNKFQQICITLDCVVHENRLKECRTLYIANRDLVVSLDPPLTAPNHPYSYPELVEGRYSEAAKTIQGLTLSIEMIDNERTVTDRYIYLAKQVFHLKPRQDPLRASGVYVGVTNTDEHGKPTVNSVRFELDEAVGKLGLHKTQEEAFSDGDIKTLRQEHIAAMNHAVQIKQLELKRLEQQLKEESDRIKAEYLRKEMAAKAQETKFNQEKMTMEAELHQLKAKHEKEKAHRESYYEQRSYERKDDHDWFKFVTGVVVAGLGILAVVMKK